jgi:hypothetical protein
MKTEYNTLFHEKSPYYSLTLEDTLCSCTRALGRNYGLSITKYACDKVGLDSSMLMKMIPEEKRYELIAALRVYESPPVVMEMNEKGIPKPKDVKPEPEKPKRVIDDL